MRASISAQARASTARLRLRRDARQPAPERSASSAASRATPRRRAAHRSFSFSPAIRICGSTSGFSARIVGDRDAGLVGDRGQRVAGLDGVGLRLRLRWPLPASPRCRSRVPLPEEPESLPRRARDDHDDDDHRADQGECGEDPGEGAGAFFHWTGEIGSSAGDRIAAARRLQAVEIVPDGGRAGAPRPRPGRGRRRSRARRRPGPRPARRRRRRRAAPGLPPWAPTPGMRKIERGISSRRRAMCSGSVAPTTAPIPLRPHSPSSRSERPSTSSARRSCRGALRRRQVLDVGGAGVAGADQGEDAGAGARGGRDQRLERVEAEQRVGGEGVGAEAGDRAPGGRRLADQRLRVGGGGDRDVAALAVGDRQQAGLVGGVRRPRPAPPSRERRGARSRRAAA